MYNLQLCCIWRGRFQDADGPYFIIREVYHKLLQSCTLPHLFPEYLKEFGVRIDFASPSELQLLKQNNEILQKASSCALVNFPNLLLICKGDDSA